MSLNLKLLLIRNTGYSQNIQNYYAMKKTKFCLSCGLIIKLDEDGRKKFCDRSCAAKYNNKQRGQKLEGKYNSLKPHQRKCLYCNSDIKSLKYCNNNCKNLMIRQEIKTKWLNGEIISISEKTPSTIRKIMLEESGYKCSLCGWGETNPTTGSIPVAIDHIDGNSRNHNRENLRVLCPNCHSLTSTYGSLNKGNGRKKRYKAKID